MDIKLKDKIVDFTAIKLEKNVGKVCRCKRTQYIVDEKQYRVYCSQCGAQVEAFKALLDIATTGSQYYEQISRLQEQRKQLEDYRPTRRVLKRIEEIINTSTFRHKPRPICPCCDEPFLLEELERGRQWRGGHEVEDRISKRLNGNPQE